MTRCGCTAGFGWGQLGQLVGRVRVPGPERVLAAEEQALRLGHDFTYAVCSPLAAPAPVHAAPAPACHRIGTLTRDLPLIVATTNPRTPEAASGADAGYHASA